MLDAPTRSTSLPRAVQALRRPNPRRDASWRALLRNPGARLFLADRRGRILFATAAGRALLGDPGPAALGEGWTRLVHDEDRDRVARAWHATARAGRPHTDEFRVCRDARQPRWLRVTVTPIGDRRGAASGFLGTLDDTTDAHRLQARQDDAGRLESLGRLVTGVAHDFNNLVTAMIGYCEIAGDDAADAHARRAVERAGETARLAAVLARQLLAFGRPGASPVRRPASLNAAVGSVATLSGRLIGRHIATRVCRGAGADLVAAVPGQLEQIVMNLVLNARDAMPDGGVLTIATACVPAPDAARVRLTVSDTGTGMDEDTRRQVFEPFFTTKPLGGHGVGLCTVQHLVRQLGADIEIESRPGDGTSVTVTFPVAARAD